MKTLNLLIKYIVLFIGIFLVMQGHFGLNIYYPSVPKDKDDYNTYMSSAFLHSDNMIRTKAHALQTHVNFIRYTSNTITWWEKEELLLKIDSIKRYNDQLIASPHKKIIDDVIQYSRKIKTLILIMGWSIVMFCILFRKV